MKILVIGGRGSIGTRYCAILEYLGIKYTILDSHDHQDCLAHLKKTCGDYYDKAIICTPTDTHYEYVDLLLDMKIPFLCEKPLSKDLSECRKLLKKAETLRTRDCDALVVNNYWFLLKESIPLESLSYNYYRTGRDGFLWDLCQLVFYAQIKNISMSLDSYSPIWTLKCDNEFIPYWKVENSYIDMIRTWLEEGPGLFNLKIGYLMTRSVLDTGLYDEDIKSYSWHSGKNVQQAIKE